MFGSDDEIPAMSNSDSIKKTSLLTHNEIDPPGVPDDFLHAGLVSRGEGEPEEEAEDVVEVIAEVQEY